MAAAVRGRRLRPDPDPDLDLAMPCGSRVAVAADRGGRSSNDGNSEGRRGGVDDGGGRGGPGDLSGGGLQGRPQASVGIGGDGGGGGRRDLEFVWIKVWTAFLNPGVILREVVPGMPRHNII